MLKRLKGSMLFRIVVIMVLSMLGTAAIMAFCSRFINFTTVTKFVVSMFYFYMLIFIFSDVNHCKNELVTIFKKYHLLTMKIEICFVTAFFFFTFIINDIMVKKYVNLVIYCIAFAIAGILAIYYHKKLKEVGL